MHEYILNPAYAAGNGLPQYISSNNAFLATATKGGLIAYGPLAATAFGEGGTPYKFNYGIRAPGDVFMEGGDARSTLDVGRLQPAAGSASQESVRARVLQPHRPRQRRTCRSSHATNWTSGISFPHYLVATSPTAGLLVSSGNPFIPASVQAQMTALERRPPSASARWPTTCRGSRRRPTAPPNRYLGGRRQRRFRSVRHELEVERLTPTSGGPRATPTRTTRATLRNSTSRWMRCVTLTTGAIVCRSTLTSPNNGCVPFNAMGTGVQQSGGAGLHPGNRQRLPVRVGRRLRRVDHGRSCSKAGPARFPRALRRASQGSRSGRAGSDLPRGRLALGQPPVR